MNIVLFTNLFPNSIEPARGNFTALIARKLAKKISLQVVSPLPWFPNIALFEKIPQLRSWGKLRKVPSQDIYEQIEVCYPKYFFLPKIGFPFQALSIYLASYLALKSLHDQGKLDLINAHWIYPDAVAAVYIAKKLKIPCIINALGCDINRYSTSFLRRIQIAWALRHSDAIMAVSHALKNKIVETYHIDQSKISVVPTGIDRSIFHPMNQEQCRISLGFGLKKKKLLFVGSLHPVKGIDTLIRALAILKNRGELSFETLLIGEGPSMIQLRSLVMELKLSPNEVSFEGQQSHDKVARYFGVADLFCLPSIREGLPNVIIEAQASGLPVVASNVGGIPELINETNGVLVPPSNPEKLAQALSFAIKNNWDRNRITQNQTIPSWDGCVDQYLELFGKILKSNSKQK